MSSIRTSLDMVPPVSQQATCMHVVEATPQENARTSKVLWDTSCSVMLRKREQTRDHTSRETGKCLLDVPTVAIILSKAKGITSVGNKRSAADVTMLDGNKSTIINMSKQNNWEVRLTAWTHGGLRTVVGGLGGLVQISAVGWPGQMIHAAMPPLAPPRRRMNG